MGRQGGSSREFTFDCVDSTLSRAEWLEQLRQHIAYGQARAQGELSRYILNADDALERVSNLPEDASCECAICLEPLVSSDSGAEAEPVGRTECGHLFHVVCAKSWLQASTT